MRRCARAEGLRPTDLGDRALVPGFVDAHAHLELTGLAGKLPAQGSFASWIRALLSERARLGPADLRAAVRHGARRLLAGGTTAVGDIDSSGAAESVLASEPLRARVYREALDAGDPERGRAALARASRKPGARLEIGVSPHAPYTVGDELLRSLGALSRRRRWPLAVHWAETEEEVLWLARERGPFSRLLKPRLRLPAPRARTPASSAGSAHIGAASARDGLAILEAAGLLSPNLALIHGNVPRRGDRERVARAGAVLVHCPGTHAFFDRAPFELSKWLRAGVTVALGTDGLSSNEDLDLRREMALLRRAHPGIRPERVFEMATIAGARAIGLEGSIGRIAPQFAADLCAHEFPDRAAGELRSRRALLEALTSGASSVGAAWIAGRRLQTVFSRPLSESTVRGAE